MKKVITAVAVSATLFSAQSCSSSPQSKSTQITNSDSQSGQPMGDMKMPDPSTQVATPDPHADPHQGHGVGGMEMPETTGSNQVKLTAPKMIAPKTSVPLDLGNYLGERAHLVILRQSSLLTGADYIHAHAQKGTAMDQIDVMIQFPQPGKYKLWCQFNRGGKITAANFWMDVREK